MSKAKTLISNPVFWIALFWIALVVIKMTNPPVEPKRSTLEEAEYHKEMMTSFAI